MNDVNIWSKTILALLREVLQICQPNRFPSHKLRQHQTQWYNFHHNSSAITQQIPVVLPLFKIQHQFCCNTEMIYVSNFSTFTVHLSSSNITKIITHAYDILYTFSVACLKQNKSKVDNMQTPQRYYGTLFNGVA